MVDSKENYKFHVGVKGLIYFFKCQNRRIKPLNDVMMGGGGVVEGRAGDKNQKGVWWDVGKDGCMKGFYDTGSPKQNISP